MIRIPKKHFNEYGGLEYDLAMSYLAPARIPMASKKSNKDSLREDSMMSNQRSSPSTSKQHLKNIYAAEKHLCQIKPAVIPQFKHKSSMLDRLVQVRKQKQTKKTREQSLDKRSESSVPVLQIEHNQAHYEIEERVEKGSRMLEERETDSRTEAKRKAFLKLAEIFNNRTNHVEKKASVQTDVTTKPDPIKFQIANSEVFEI